MALGSTKPWAEVIAKVLPPNSKLSAAALLEYYEPMKQWLEKKNKEFNVTGGWSATKKSMYCFLMILDII